MKKVSTAGAKQSRNISQQKLTIGLDLGDRNSWYSVVNEAGQIQTEPLWPDRTVARREILAEAEREILAVNWILA